MDDAVLYMLHQIYNMQCEDHYFDFSSAFNTVQPQILKDFLVKMVVNPTFTLWIHGSLTRPLFVKLGSCTSRTLVSDVGAL